MFLFQPSSFVLAMMMASTAVLVDASGCCSHNYKSCVNWCGNTPAECNSSPQFCYWLDNGRLDSSCKIRWSTGCSSDSDCCDGLTCQQFSGWSQCNSYREVFGSNPPSETTTEQPQTTTSTATSTTTTTTEEPTSTTSTTPEPTTTTSTTTTTTTTTEEPTTTTEEPTTTTPEPTTTEEPTTTTSTSTTTTTTITPEPTTTEEPTTTTEEPTTTTPEPTTTTKEPTTTTTTTTTTTQIQTTTSTSEAGTTTTGSCTPSAENSNMIVGELTMWTDSENAVTGGSCEYAKEEALRGNGPQSWLDPYIIPKMYCAVSDDLYDNGGAGCGKCYKIVYDGLCGTNPATAGEAIIQVVDSGAGGTKHFDCFITAFEAMTGTNTGIFPVSYEQVDCEPAAPLNVVMMDGNNAYYTKVLVAGGTTSVIEMSITIGDTTYDMFRVSGATWAAHTVNGATNVPVQFDATFADGTTGSVNACYDGIWPVPTGTECSLFIEEPETTTQAQTTSTTTTTQMQTTSTSTSLRGTSTTVAATTTEGTTISPPESSSLLSTDNAMSAWDVFEGLAYLTNFISTNPPIYGLGSSGGAAGGVVSESQGYALMVTGVVLASWDTHASTHANADRNQVLDAFEGYFNGWKKMCQNSANGSCQSDTWCHDTVNDIYSICLPGWKHHDDLSYQIGTGAAPDGDEDAIAGMIYAIKAVAQDDPKPSWYNEVRSWIDASLSAFMKYNVAVDSPFRLLKLGSCWGGWEGNGNNPSYHAPGAYKMFRDYQLEFPDEDRNGYSAYSEVEWNQLIETSYHVLDTVQCPYTGMVPNWARIQKDSSSSLSINSGGFSGSNTDQYEFGSEAARTIWRLAFDAAAYPEDLTADIVPLLEPMVNTLDKQVGESWTQSTFPSCSVPGMSSSVYAFPNWVNEGFIYGPVFSSLIVPIDGLEGDQQAMLDEAGQILSSGSLSTDYYPRCWVLLANLAIGGALESAATVLDFALPPRAPTIAPVPTAAPVPTPTAPTVPNSADACCSHDFKNCVGWDCGNTEATCGSCSNEAYQWLPNGPITDSCMARWVTACTANSDCCEGLECRFHTGWSQCVHSSE